jgi:nicotinamide-nucleotide amidase
MRSYSQRGYLRRNCAKRLLSSCFSATNSPSPRRVGSITEIAGSSEWYDRGFITYSNAAKQEMLGVQAKTLHIFGAVSEPTVLEMVSGALERSRAQVAVSVSGVAGPGGGTVAKPVGVVCIGWGAVKRTAIASTYSFSGDRESVRRQSVIEALNGVLRIIEDEQQGGARPRGQRNA